MTRTHWNICIAAILSLAAVLLFKPAAVSAQEPIPDQVIVKLTPGSDIESVIFSIEGTPLDSIIGLDAFLVSFPDSMPLQLVMGRLEENPSVLGAFENHVLTFNEPYQISQSFPDQNHPPYVSGLSPADYWDQSGSFDIGLESASNLARGDGVTVAVIDNGLKLSHPLFDSALTADMYDYIDGDEVPEEVEGSLYGHGTFVSGLVRLAASECKVMPLRAFDSSGTGASFYAAMAIWDAISHGVDIINMSFGSYVSDEFLAMAVVDAHAAGIVMVAAAGNDSTDFPTYPAAYPEVLAVSAVDQAELAADWTNYGSYIDVCAPGVEVYSALPGEYEWGTWSGTSFAAPLVSGTIALVKSRNPSLTVSQAADAVRLSARDSLDWGWVPVPDPYYGYGQMDAFNAVLGWSRGDVDESGTLNVSDLTFLVDHLFRGGEAPPTSMLQGDVNCSGELNVSDLTVMADFLFRGEDIARPCYY